MLIVKNSNNGIDKLIKEYEEKNELTFSATFKNFLEKYNGGKHQIHRLNQKVYRRILNFYGDS